MTTRKVEILDRRHALKQIGAAGAVVVATPLVMSSPAFAYDSPTAPSGAAISATTIGSERVNVNTVSFGTASCPASANSTTAAASFLRWEISKLSTTPSNATIQLRPDGGGGVIATLPATYTTQSTGFRLRKRNSNGNQDITLSTGDSFNVDLVVRYTCTYSDGTTRTLDHTHSFTITKGSGGSSANDWIVAGP